MRIDPPVSVPSATAAIPSATEAAALDDEPPAIRASPGTSRRYGERGVPKCGFRPRPENANSLMLVRPTSTAPARLSRATAAASACAGGAPSSTREPARVTWPATSNRSFTDTGMPASGDSTVPAARSRSCVGGRARVVGIDFGEHDGALARRVGDPLERDVDERAAGGPAGGEIVGKLGERGKRREGGHGRLRDEDVGQAWRETNRCGARRPHARPRHRARTGARTVRGVRAGRPTDAAGDSVTNQKRSERSCSARRISASTLLRAAAAIV
jgi:hypothetical protein